MVFYNILINSKNMYLKKCIVKRQNWGEYSLVMYSYIAVDFSPQSERILLLACVIRVTNSCYK